MNYQITHRTFYQYESPVSVSFHAARLEPRADDGQTCENFTIQIDPEPITRSMRTDYYGNRVCFFPIQQSHHTLEIVSRSRVALPEKCLPLPQQTPPWEQVAEMFRDPVAAEMIPFVEFTFASLMAPVTNTARNYAQSSFPPGRPLLEASKNLIQRIYKDFTFDPKATTTSTPIEEVFENRRGVCQDFAHLGISCFRSMGIPARYVSGYLRTIPPEGKEKLRGIDASHAWLSVYFPKAGWIDFDPTNNCIPKSDHIVIAYGRDFSDVSPISGVILGGGEHQVQVGVDVEVV